MLSYEQILLLHDAALREHGGNPGILNENAILSAINQPLQTFGGDDLYPGPIAKSAALGYFLTKAHGFGDGNKRVGYMAMKVALLQQGYHLTCTPDEGEFIILAVAESEADLEELTVWVEDHIDSARPNALSEISAAMIVFVDSSVRQGKYFGAYRRRMDAHSKESNLITINPRTDAFKRMSKIDKAIASDILTLSNQLKPEILIMQEKVKVIDDNASNIARWIDALSTDQKDKVLDLLVTLGRLVNDSETMLHHMERLRQQMEKGHIHSESLRISCADLINTIDDIKAVFNQSWFSYKDMAADLKSKLN